MIEVRFTKVNNGWVVQCNDETKDYTSRTKAKNSAWLDRLLKGKDEFVVLIDDSRREG